ncbi:uncharacterized protein LOC122363369 isoform X2 [Amphibalanus amphitrite]|uniref:uncharacterized protein LOC122363369 isoform X2 n=1 Tax=Amphibalanus amphitrite TaxID=1232801 RepID=UPI001C900CBC|nr:uncharacterized protein LOC122363369 isoform X2 [Amphibalanus amphitrite]
MQSPMSIQECALVILGMARKKLVQPYLLGMTSREGGAAAVAAPSPVTLLEQAQRRASELEAALAKKSAELEQVKSQHSAEESQMRSVLTENQLTMLKTGRRPHRWDDESVIKAMGIRTSTSKRVYEYLREQQGWPLPSIRSISSWVSGLRIEPSSMAQFLQFLQVAAAETAPLAKNCAILFDEMSVDTRLCYDQQRDVIVGPHKQAQVIMASVVLRRCSALPEELAEPHPG